MVKFALQTRKTSQNHDIFIKNQAKSLIFHGFPCQNFPAVNRNSRHAYRGGRWRPACFFNLLIRLVRDHVLRPEGHVIFSFRK